MNIRKLKESDWGTLQDWWNNWPDWVPPQKDFLPDNGTGGLIVEKNNTKDFFANPKSDRTKLFLSQIL